MFSIKADFDRAERILSDLGRKQLPFATALALNDTGADVKDVEEAAIERDFDAPTPFTKRGVYLRRAGKSRLIAEVGIKRVQKKYLDLQARGGVRRPKGRALVVPVGQRVNKYGNMARGAVGRLVKKPSTFVAGRGQRGTAHLPPGIYQRPRGRRRSPKLMVAFEPRARYEARFRFQEPALREARRRFEGHLVRRLRQAIATAK